MLTERNIIYITNYVYFGPEYAKRRSKYSRAQIWHIWRRPECIEFYIKTMKKYLEENNIEVKDLVKFLWDFAKNDKINDRERRLAVQYVLDGCERESERGSFSPYKEISVKQTPVLSPSKTSFDEKKAKKLQKDE